MLEAIADSNKRIGKTIAQRIKGLSQDPQKQGKPLFAELTGFRSLRVGRYRVIYTILEDNKVVVAAVGIRKEGDREDIYRIAKKLLSLGLIELPMRREKRKPKKRKK